MTRAETRAMWAERMAAQQASGRSAADWCAACDVALQSFYLWRRRLAAEAAPDAPRWVAVEPLSGEAPLLVRVGAVTIEVRVGFDPALLAEVVRAVARC